MKIIAKCPRCNHKLPFTLDDADKRVRCSNCEKLFKIPDIKTLQPAIDAIKDSKANIYVDAKGNVYA